MKMHDNQQRGKRRSPALPEEATLVEQARQGDRESFRILVDTHKNYVFTILMKQIGEHSLAEDLAQEIFVKAYRGLKQFRGDAQFRTWLTRITLNHCKNFFRSRRYKELQANVSEIPEHHSINHLTPETQLEKKQELHAFRRALQQLPDKQREALLLCALQGMSYQDAATLLQIPVGTVRSRINGARQQMKETLAETFAVGGTGS